LLNKKKQHNEALEPVIDCTGAPCDKREPRVLIDKEMRSEQEHRIVQSINKKSECRVEFGSVSTAQPQQEEQQDC